MLQAHGRNSVSQTSRFVHAHDATCSDSATQAVFSLREQDEPGTEVSGEKDTCLQLTSEQAKLALCSHSRRAFQTGKSGQSVAQHDVAASFMLVEGIWGSMETNISKPMHHHDDKLSDYNYETGLKAAQKSQRNDKTKNLTSTLVHEKASVQMSQLGRIDTIVNTWKVQELKTCGSNTEQKDVINLIATRVLQEDNDHHDGTTGHSEPLSALICGGPGGMNTMPQLLVTSTELSLWQWESRM